MVNENKVKLPEQNTNERFRMSTKKLTAGIALVAASLGLFAAGAGSTQAATVLEERPTIMAANNTINDPADAIEADGIANGYIQHSAHLISHHNQISGRAQLTTFKSYGTINTNNQMLPNGTTVYLRWMDEDGTRSPVYKAKTHDLAGCFGNNGGKGVYSFDLREGFEDAAGNHHTFKANKRQYYQLWIPDYINEAGNTVTMYRQAGGFFAGSWASANLGGLGQTNNLINHNIEKTAINMYELPAGFKNAGETYMTRPRNEWIYDKKGSIKNVAVNGDSSASVVFSGRVWLETSEGNYGEPIKFNQQDTGAPNYTVVLSMLTNEGQQAYQANVRSLPEGSQQSKAAKALLEAHPEYIAVTVYGKTNSKGWYSLRVPKKFHNNFGATYMFVMDDEDKVVTSYSRWTTPVFEQANSKIFLSPQAVPYYNAIGIGSPTYYDIHFGVVPNTMLDFNITNYNTTDKPANYGDTANLEIKGQSGYISPLTSYIQWTDSEGIKVGDRVPVSRPSDATKGNMTVAKDGMSVTINGKTTRFTRRIKRGEIFTATLVTGTVEMGKDSFMILGRTMAETYSPKGQDVMTTLGNLPNIEDFIEHDDEYYRIKVEQPGTKFTWITTPELVRPGDYPGPILVTYPDGSTDTIKVRIHVKDPETGFGGANGEAGKQSGLYNPKADDIIVKINTEPDAAKTIVNKQDLPADAKITFTRPIDTTVPGDREAFVLVTYSDGSFDVMKIVVHVQRQY